MHRLLFICLLMLFIGAGSKKKKKCKHNSNNLYPNPDLVKKKKRVINVLTIFFHFP